MSGVPVGMGASAGSFRAPVGVRATSIPGEGVSQPEPSSQSSPPSRSEARPLASSRHAHPARSSRQEPDSAAVQAELKSLKQIDAAVRRHEAAHAAVGGPYAGAPSFEYRKGPDGVLYAVAGEVPIDVAPVAGDPQATIEKMEVVARAAMAPADPSPQDRQVAAQASRTRQEALVELARMQQLERQESSASAVTPAVVDVFA